METIDVLKKARELLSDPKRWTKGWFARNADGRECMASDEDACCWCAIGAIEKQFNHHTREWEAAIAALEPHSIGLGPAGVNDRRGHAAVLAMFDAAIAAQESP